MGLARASASQSRAGREGMFHLGVKEKFQMNEINPMLKAFLKDEQAQDLIEYTLLVAFVCLATAALFVNSGGSLSGIWISANSQLGVANTSAS
jgi:Flp pilus assembly pilin Flp